MKLFDIAAMALSISACALMAFAPSASGRSLAQGEIDALTREGVKKASAGDLDQAVKLFTASLRSSKDNVHALYNRGKVLLIMRHVEDAKKDLDRAIKLDPGIAGAFAARGLAHRLAGDFPKAIKDLNEAVTRDPQNTALLIHRASLLFDVGSHDKALEDLSAVIHLNPGAVKALGDRAYIFEQLGKYDEAVRDLSAILAQKPDHLLAMKHLGFVYRQKGEQANAIRWYKEALKLEQNVDRRKRLHEEIQELERRTKAQ